MVLSISEAAEVLRGLVPGFSEGVSYVMSFALEFGRPPATSREFWTYWRM